MADNENPQQQTVNVNEQIKIRQDKLKAMQEEGKDPFVITKYDVTDHSSEAKEKFEELDAKLKFFAKVKTSRGIEYKALPTRKMPGKGELMLQAPINVAQFDTIYLGKRISESELKDYFFEVDSPTQAASFAVGRRFFVAYRVDKRGGYELRKALRDLFRIVPDQEEDTQPREEKRKNVNPDEIID